MIDSRHPSVVKVTANPPLSLALSQLVDGLQTFHLKSKNCLEPAGKAELYIETRLVFNALRASLRTINPREAKVLLQPDKFNRKLLVSNARRLTTVIRTIVTWLQFVNGLFSWENKVHSALALVVSCGEGGRCGEGSEVWGGREGGACLCKLWGGRKGRREGGACVRLAAMSYFSKHILSVEAVVSNILSHPTGVCVGLPLL